MEQTDEEKRLNDLVSGHAPTESHPIHPLYIFPDEMRTVLRESFKSSVEETKKIIKPMAAFGLAIMMIYSSIASCVAEVQPKEKENEAIEYNIGNVVGYQSNPDYALNKK